ncbi:MAG: hypothetical protein RIB59_00355 [Rhodospirillales bacterium]
MKIRYARTAFLGLSALAVLSTLSSCSWFGDKKKVEAKVPCPHVAVISDADLYTHFQPGAKWDRDSLRYEAQIVKIKSACDFSRPKSQPTPSDKDKKAKVDDGPKTLLAAITVTFEVHVYPKYKGQDARLKYFVAITDRQTNVLNKQTFDIAAPKPKWEETKGQPLKSRSVYFTDKPVTLRIPLKKGQIGPDFHIFAGFQLSPEHLELNRKRRRPPEAYGIKDPDGEPKSN